MVHPEGVMWFSLPQDVAEEPVDANPTLLSWFVVSLEKR